MFKYTIHRSFTSTWKAFYVEEDKLDKETYQQHFYFSCHKSHVFRTDGTLPNEVTWIPDMQSIITENSVNRDDVNWKVLLKWDNFMEIIRDAEQYGNIIWGDHPQAEFVRTWLQGNEHP